MYFDLLTTTPLWLERALGVGGPWAFIWFNLLNYCELHVSLILLSCHFILSLSLSLSVSLSVSLSFSLYFFPPPTHSLSPSLSLSLSLSLFLSLSPTYTPSTMTLSGPCGIVLT